MSDTRLVESLKLNNRVNIIIKKGFKKLLFSNSELDNEDKNSESSPINYSSSVCITTLFNKIVGKNSNSLEQLYDFSIKNKHKKIIRHK